MVSVLKLLAVCVLLTAVQSLHGKQHTQASCQNLIRNGGFEFPPVGKETDLPKIPGWRSSFGAKTIKITNGPTLNPSVKSQVAELDANSNLIQKVRNLKPGQSYQLLVEYAKRVGREASKNSFTVYWDGKVVKTVKL